MEICVLYHIWYKMQWRIKSKGKGYLIVGHEDPDGELYPFFNSALDGVGGQGHGPAAVPPGKRPGTHCTGGRVGPRAGLDGCGKSRPHRKSISGPSSP
jgi:hypothetical protein